jgi:hypothetical protein
MSEEGIGVEWFISDFLNSDKGNVTFALPLCISLGVTKAESESESKSIFLAFSASAFLPRAGVFLLVLLLVSPASSFSHLKNVVVESENAFS